MRAAPAWRLRSRPRYSAPGRITGSPAWVPTTNSTRGGEGISAVETGRRIFHLPAYSREVFDVTGAGDTVVAVLTLALTTGCELREAVALANAAASIVVERVGTSQVTPEELLERMASILKRH